MFDWGLSRQQAGHWLFEIREHFTVWSDQKSISFWMRGSRRKSHRMLSFTKHTEKASCPKFSRSNCSSNVRQGRQSERVMEGNIFILEVENDSKWRHQSNLSLALLCIDLCIILNYCFLLILPLGPPGSTAEWSERHHKLGWLRTVVEQDSFKVRDDN